MKTNTIKTKTCAEYQEALGKRAAVVSDNSIRRLTGHADECLLLPPKPDKPLCPVAYAADGTYEGRLNSPEDCPTNCVVEWEPMLR